MNKPLADRIRPTELDDVVGQKHLLGEGKALRRLIEAGDIPNLIFYGPSGVGKTTVASIIASKTKRSLRRLNGTTASTQDIKDIVNELDTFSAPNGILLYLDEIQYFNKRQQQSLLEYIENGKITLIASTTENPYFYIYPAILSRSTVFEFKSVEPDEVIPAIKRGFNILADEYQVKLDIEEDVFKRIASGCGGDVRKSLNSVENCFFATPTVDGKKNITTSLAKEFVQKSAVRYDRDSDEHYDIISAYQKSMRGSDPNAALHYLARLLQSGDLPSACRRLMVCACEDVGLAYPQIIPIVKSAVDIAMMVGLPEARIPLADAVILVQQHRKVIRAKRRLIKQWLMFKAEITGRFRANFKINILTVKMPKKKGSFIFTRTIMKITGFISNIFLTGLKTKNIMNLGLIKMSRRLNHIGTE